MSLSEFDIIKRYFRPLGRPRGEVRLGIGDDAAVLAPPPGRDWVLTLDTLVAGVHFPEDAPADAVGHKALAANLSDLAAMGAEPVAALLSLTTPGFDPDWLEGFCAGFDALAKAHDVSLIGGDTTRGPLVVAVQATGTVPTGTALRRDGARPGDVILVSGTLGDAAMGLAAWESSRLPEARGLIRRLHYPTPRITLGRLLRGRARACIDISDGLLADLGHILEASGVGGRIAAASVPCSADFLALCPPEERDRKALTWGDDYELCACVPPGDADALCAEARALGESLTVVGEITRDPGLAVLDEAGRTMSLEASGYRHFPGDSEARS